MKERTFRMPTAYTILFLLIAAVAISTRFIPAGSYTYVEGVPQAGTYHPVEAAPAGLGDVLKASFSGFYDAVDVCVFILMVGGNGEAYTAQGTYSGVTMDATGIAGVADNPVVF